MKKNNSIKEHKQKTLSFFKILFFSILIFMINCDFGLPPEEEDNAAIRASNKLKVFILAGQSNMEGKGVVEPKQSQIDKNGGKGTMRYLYNHDKTKYKYLVNSSGEWAARNSVWIVDVSQQGALKVDFAKKTMGPELQFGHEMGDYYKNNTVLLIKTAWGGKSLYENFRPPSSGKTGECYNDMIKRVDEVLKNIKKFYPDYNGQGYDLVGFAWHQGWNDRVNEDAVDEYKTNCVNLINDIRDDLKKKNLTSQDDLPFVIANTGMGGDDVKPKALKLMNDQMAVPLDSRIKKKDKIGAVETRKFYIDSSDSPNGFTFHWNCNAESYMMVGEAMGKMMIKILDKGGLYGVESGDDGDDDDNTGSDEYKLVVNSGSGDGKYSAKKVVTIKADPPPSGQVFKKWKVNSGNPDIKQTDSSTTTLTMPSENVEITAKYQDAPDDGPTDPPDPDEYKLTVNDGSGDGKYTANKVVTIIADTPPSGKIFDKWIIDSGNPDIKKIDSSSTTLTMPSSDVEISASYKDEEDAGCGNILSPVEGDGNR
jgi:alpha-galactosidase